MRRVLRWLVRGLAALIVLCLALPTAVLVALRFPAPRAVVAGQIDAALSTLFRGRVHLDRLERLGLEGARVSGRIDDPAGRTVVRFEHLDVTMDVPRFLVGLARSGGTPRSITLERVALTHADVHLIDDGHGVPTLAAAFEPRAPSKTGAPSAPAPSVVVRELFIRHAWVHGEFGATPHLDVDVSDLEGKLGVDASRFQVEIEGARLASRLQPFALDPAGRLAGRLRIPLGPGPTELHAEFEGAVAEAPLEATGSLVGDQVEASVTVPRLDERTLRHLSSSLTLSRPVALRASASGTTGDLRVKLHAEGDPGRIDASGTVRALERTELELRLDAAALDASAVLPEAPRTDVKATLHATLASAPGGYRGRYALSLERPSLEAAVLPSVETQGTLAVVQQRVSVDGDTDIRGRGASARLGYSLRLEAGRGSVAAQGRVELDHPPWLSKIAGIETSGTVALAANVQLPTPIIDASANVRLAEIVEGPVRAGPTRAYVRASGPLSSPALEGVLSSRGLRALGRTVPRLTVEARGEPRALAVCANARLVDDAELAARADVRVASAGLVVERAAARYRDRAGRVRASAARVSLAGKRVEVDGVALDGAGTLDGSFALEGARFRAEAHARELDLPRLAAIAGVETPLRSARATFAVKVARGRALDANVQGRIDHVRYDGVEHGKLAFNLLAQHGRVSGKLDTELVRGARFVVDLGELDATTLAWAPVELPTGQLRARGRLDLACMTPLLSALPGFPIARAHGSVNLDLAYRRMGLHARPELSGSVRTHDLAFVSKRSANGDAQSRRQALAAQPVVYGGADLGLDFAFDSGSGRLTAHLGVYDARAPLLEVDASGGPFLDGSLADALNALGHVPLEVHARVPARRLDALPRPLRPNSFRGTVGGELELSGTLDAPELVLDARASNLAAEGVLVRGDAPQPHLSVLAHAEYQRSGGSLRLAAGPGGARAVDAAARWTGDVMRATSARAALGTLEMEAQATIHALDLQTLPPLVNRQLGGTLSGSVRAKYGSTERYLFADLAVHPLAFGQAALDRLDVTLDARPGCMRAAVSGGGSGSSLAASLNSGLAWPPHALPSLEGELAARLRTKAFRLALLKPLLGSAVSDLDGRLTTDLAANVTDGAVALSGNGRIRDGVVQLPAIGQRFEEITGHIKVASPAIVIPDLRARGLTGGLSANLRAELDQRLGLRELTADVSIEKKHQLPVTIEGVALGDAWGKIHLKLVEHADRVALNVSVPTLHVSVPNTSGLGVQSLAPDEAVDIGVYRESGTFVDIPQQPFVEPEQNPTPLFIEVELGHVWLEEGDMVNAELTGKLHVKVAEEAPITGQIRLEGGTLFVSGKRFELERGTVTFDGASPPNPMIDAVARWDAPAGYGVFATYAGTIQKGKLTLHSEPPLSQNEIVNLVLFGTPEGSVGSGGGNTAASVVGLAGSTAAKGLNHAISEFAHLDVQARIDTSTGAARPELMVPITPRISARVTRAIGEPSPGTSPDRTFLTLVVRLKWNWAVSATVGDRGASSLDLVWRKHY